MPGRLFRIRSFVAALIAPVAMATAPPDPASDAQEAPAAQFPEGSTFGMQPFPGSYLAETFDGFFRDEDKASVVVQDLAMDDWEEVADAFLEPTSLATRQITARTIEETTVLGREAIRIVGTQTRQGVEIPKCILLIRNEQKVGIFSAQIAEPAAEGLDACALIQGIAVRPPPSLDDKLAGLPFRFADYGGLRATHVLAGSAAVFTDGPKDIVEAAEQPTFIVASSLVKLPRGVDRQALASEQIQTIATYAIEGPIKLDEITIGGLDAVEATAQAVDLDSPVRVRIVQWTVYAPDGLYLRMIGIARPEHWDEAYAKFAAMRDELEWPAGDEDEPVAD